MFGTPSNKLHQGLIVCNAVTGRLGKNKTIVLVQTNRFPFAYLFIVGIASSGERNKLI